MYKLLLSWRYMLAGSFNISDFALFTYFLPVISDFAMSIGQSFAAYRRSEQAETSTGPADRFRRRSGDADARIRAGAVWHSCGR